MTSCTNYKALVMQTLRNMQGTKYSGHEWYTYLSTIFEDLGMVSNTICKGIFIWKQDDILAYLILATDDILFATISAKEIHSLETEFHTYSSFPMQKGNELSFLNFRII